MMKTNKTAVSIFVILMLIFTNFTAVAATPPEPTYNTAVVDGNYSEWDLTNDFFANMYRAGNPTKPLESKAYIRYDVTSGTVYTLVLTEPNIPAMANITPEKDYNAMAWTSIIGTNGKAYTGNSGNNGIPSDFAWIGLGFDGNPNHALGYEASYQLGLGQRNIVIHIEVFDSAADQTSATVGFPLVGTPLLLNNVLPPNPEPKENPSLTVMKLTNGVDVTSQSEQMTLLKETPVTWSYVVTNTGDVVLEQIIVTDAPEGLIGTIDVLQPGESVRLEKVGSTIIGQYTNNVTASTVYKETPISSSDSSFYFGADPSVKIVTLIGDNDANESRGPEFAVGEEITWIYKVTNTGNVPLTDVKVTNELGAVIGIIPYLASGETIELTEVTIASAGQHANIGSVLGIPPSGLPSVNSQDPAYYYGVIPSIDLIKYVSIDNGLTWLDANSNPVPQIQVGKPVLYKLVVTNTGEVALNNIVLADDKIDVSALNVNTTLQAGASLEYVVGPVNASYGYMINTASATGQYHNRPYTDSDIAQYFGAMTSYTQGGYQGKGNPGKIFTTYFTSNLFPNGMTIGVYEPANTPNGFKWTTDSTGKTNLKSYLAGGGPSTALTKDLLNPTKADIGGTLGTQTATLTLNISFSGTVPTMPSGFGNLIYTDSSSSLNGMSISQILEIANQALGTGNLPSGYTFGTLNTLITQLNESFDNGIATEWAKLYLK